MLAVEVEDDAGGLAFVFNYKTDLFDDATIEGLMAAYLSLAETAAIAPERRLSQL